MKLRALLLAVIFTAVSSTAACPQDLQTPPK